MTIVADFLAKVRAIYKTGEATEHSYRAAIASLMDGLDQSITALNEPKRVACGAPDFIIHRGEIVIGHIEAKDIDVDLRVMEGANTEQKDRYLKALPNLIYTNCLDFDFYRNGELVASASIADFLMGITPKTEQFGVT